MTLLEFLEWGLSGGGAAALGYLIVSKINWKPDFPSERKRLIALAIAFLIADIIYTAMVFLAYKTMPANWQE